METTNEEEEEILEKLWELIVEKGKVEVESKKIAEKPVIKASDPSQ